MKFCPSCGSPQNDGARFCENCGTALSAPPAAAPPAPAPAAPAAAAPQQSAPQQSVPLPPAPPAAPFQQPVPPQPGAPRKSRKGLVTGLGGVAAVGVLGVVGYLVYDQLAGPSGGAESPQAAVLELSAAANAEDPVTALSLLPPGEVGPIVDLYRDVEAKATSTGVADAEKPFAGFDVRLDDVAVRTEQLGDDVAAVTITSGTVSWTLDPTQMQGALRIGADGDVREGGEGSADLVEITREAVAGTPLRIMTVQQDGTWYVSPSYTLLEAWRVSQGLPAPDFSKEIDLEGTGADSAEAAVTDAVQAAAGYDVDRLLDLLSPDEAAALYQYRDAITTALHRDGALADLQSEGRLEVVSLVAKPGEEVDGRVPVTVSSASGGLYDDDGDYISWTLDSNCVSWNDRGHGDGGCLDEVFAESGLGPDMASRFESLTLLTQEVDGRWYLAPLATMVAEARDAVAGVDADAVAAMLGVPQFGGVDGTLVEGETIDGSTEHWSAPALYEMDVPAGQVFSVCVDGDAKPYFYGPDGRPVGNYGDVVATQAADGGRYRVAVSGQSDMAATFRITPELSTPEQITVPGTVPAADGAGCGIRLVGFEATAGEPLVLGTEGGSLLQLTMPGGETTWASAFVPKRTGTHYVAVPAGMQVSIDHLPDDVLTDGDSVSVPLPATATTSATVFVPEGGATINVAGGYPFIQLYDADGYLSQEGWGTPYVASVYPDSPGIYQLVIEDYDPSGAVQVSVRR